VTAIRSPGLADDPPPWFGTDPALPRAWHAGPWLARDGAFFDGGGRRVDLADFPSVAAAQALATAAQPVPTTTASPSHAKADDPFRSGHPAALPGGRRGGWVKLIGDWPGTDPLPLDVMTATADAVHAVGGRLAVHCQHEQSCYAAVFGGADSIEHGQYLGLDLIDEMVARKTTWVPTLAVMQESLARLHTLDPTPDRLRSIASREAMPAIIAAAAEAGVTILAGTDSAALTIIDEIKALLGTGMPAPKALGAASWTARSFLGLPSLTEGAPADAVIYAENPLLNPATLAHPTRVILRGTVVR
jgi:hypothetical protein